MRWLPPVIVLALLAAWTSTSDAAMPAQGSARAPNETLLQGRIERAESVDSKTLNVEPQQMWCALDLKVVEVTSATGTPGALKKDDKVRVFARGECGARGAGQSIRVAVTERGGPNVTPRWWVTRF